jgi:20S proteasome alpha/beta subunit
MLGQHSRILFLAGSSCVVGCFGLDSDSRQLFEHVQEKLSHITDKDGVGPDSVANIISKYLYRKQLYCTPIIVGLCNGAPYICSMDSLGAITSTDSYAVIGTTSSAVLSLCESLYKTELDVISLVSLIERIMKLALQRDVLSGGRVNLVTVTAQGVFCKEFETFDV